MEVTLNKTAVRLCVPHVITQTCEFIRKEITTEGIFRKSGSTSRVQSLKVCCSDTVIFSLGTYDHDLFLFFCSNGFQKKIQMFLMRRTQLLMLLWC